MSYERNGRVMAICVPREPGKTGWSPPRVSGKLCSPLGLVAMKWVCILPQDLFQGDNPDAGPLCTKSGLNALIGPIMYMNQASYSIASSKPQNEIVSHLPTCTKNKDQFCLIRVPFRSKSVAEPFAKIISTVYETTNSNNSF